MFCPKCGKEVREGTKFCPKCGANFLQTVNSAMAANDNISQEATYSTSAIVGFIISIISLCLDVDSGIVFGIIGLIFSIIGLNQCKEKMMKGTGMAIAGIVCGGISVLCIFM